MSNFKKFECLYKHLASSVPQVTVHYDQKDGAVIPKRVHTIVISVQHDDCISLEEQKKVLKEKVECQKEMKGSQTLS